MDYVANRNPQIADMLRAIGISKIDELFTAIPDRIKVPSPLLDDGMSEYEGIRWMEAIAAKNTFPDFEHYLGAGAYEHHVPAIVQAICSKSEFLTSYTPYQPEASQGMLQAIFEYQSAICVLTGMDVSNASVYDGASACAEALLMALRAQPKKPRVLIAESVHPHSRGVAAQYLCHPEMRLESLPFDASGKLDLEYLQRTLNDDVAAILLQSPNFFGIIEKTQEVVQIAKSAGALTILCGNPLSYGLFKSPGEMGIDIAVGDCQPFGLPLNFGGPYAGYIACRQEWMRQLPGRIVGQTQDTQGRRGFVLTLQAREQHIRREKATSNICTNQALAALASLVAILWYGKKGVHALALTNHQRCAYLRSGLAEIPGVRLLEGTPFFNECAVRFPDSCERVRSHFRSHGIEPGVHLGDYYPRLMDYFLVAVTETKSRAQLDRYIQTARMLGK